MVKSEIGEMVFMMGKMIENVERLLEELRSLQKDIQIKIDHNQDEEQETNSKAAILKK